MTRAFNEDRQLTRNFANTSDASHIVVPWCLELGSWANCKSWPKTSNGISKVVGVFNLSASMRSNSTKNSNLESSFYPKRWRLMRCWRLSEEGLRFEFEFEFEFMRNQCYLRHNTCVSVCTYVLFKLWTRACVRFHVFLFFSSLN